MAKQLLITMSFKLKKRKKKNHSKLQHQPTKSQTIYIHFLSIPILDNIIGTFYKKSVHFCSLQINAHS